MKFTFIRGIRGQFRRSTYYTQTYPVFSPTDFEGAKPEILKPKTEDNWRIDLYSLGDTIAKSTQTEW